MPITLIFGAATHVPLLQIYKCICVDTHMLIYNNVNGTVNCYYYCYYNNNMMYTSDEISSGFQFFSNGCPRSISVFGYIPAASHTYGHFPFTDSFYTPTHLSFQFRRDNYNRSSYYFILQERNRRNTHVGGLNQVYAFLCRYITRIQPRAFRAGLNGMRSR